MNIEQIGSAIIQPNICIRHAEMMTPTDPKVSARMWRNTPRMICEFCMSRVCEWPWFSPPAWEWPWLFNRTSVIKLEVRKNWRNAVNSLAYRFHDEYCESCVNVMNLRRDCVRGLHHVGMHICRLNLLEILELTPRKVARAWPEMKFVWINSLLAQLYRQLTSGGSINRSTDSDRMKNEINKRNKLFTKPASTSART